MVEHWSPKPKIWVRIPFFFFIFYLSFLLKKDFLISLKLEYIFFVSPNNKKIKKIKIKN